MAASRIAPAPQTTTPPPSRAPSRTPSLELIRLTANVRGTLLIARIRFLLGRGDAEAERVLKRLTAEDRETLRSTILPSSWYPAALLQRLDTAAAAILTRGDRRELFLEMGRFSADVALAPKGFQRPFVHEGDPQFLLENVPRIWASQHSTGHRVFERTGPRSALLRHFDRTAGDPDDCFTTVGWLERAVETCGGKAPLVLERECRGHGAACCVFAIEWR